MTARKTRDVYEIQGAYGVGWETVTSETDRAEARARLAEYRDNEPDFPHRIRKVRETIEPGTCRPCGAPVDALETFPGGLCLECWAKTPEGRRMPTADEVVAMWGGPVR